MTHAIRVHNALSGFALFLEHAAAVMVGFVMMIVGLGMGVTVIMLPIGIVIGFLGLALLVGGLFARIDRPSC